MKTREQLETEIHSLHDKACWGDVSASWSDVVIMLDMAGLLMPEGWERKPDEYEWLGGSSLPADAREAERLLKHALIGYDHHAESLPELAQEIAQALRTAEDAHIASQEEAQRLSSIITRLRANLGIKTNVEHDEYLAMIERRFKAVREAVAK
jgi:hypothetical protein